MTSPAGEALPPDWIEFLRRAPGATTVLVPGYIDLDRRPEQVRLYPLSVAFGTADGYLIFEVEEAGGQLSVGIRPDVALPEELADEPSIRPMFVDLGAEVLGDVLPVGINGITAYADRQSDLSRSRIRGVRLDLRGGVVIALDPFWTPGIKIGGSSLAGQIEAAVTATAGGRVLSARLNVA